VIERSKDVGRGKYDGKVKLTATASPKEFEFYGDELGGNKVWFFGVYELTADEFKICYFRATTPEDRSKRATDFTTRQGVPPVMNKFKRVASLPAPSWTPLFNGKDLTNFYTYLGTVAEIGGTVKKDSQSYGKNNDPEGVFTVREDVLRISGKVFGGLVTEKEYENYHLKVEYRWGNKTWPPREMMARDSGIILHCAWSEDGFRGWPHSFVECQVIEGGTGDLIPVGNGTQKLSVEAERRDGQMYFKPGATLITQTRGRFNWLARDSAWKDVKDFRGKQDVERPLGEWNTLECICERDKITAILNGKVVNVGNYTGRVKGNIIIQSQGAEIFLRKIEIKLLSPTNAGTR